MRTLAAPRSIIPALREVNGLRTDPRILRIFLEQRNGRYKLGESEKSLEREAATYQRLLKGHRRPQACAFLEEVRDEALGWITLPDGHLTAWTQPGGEKLLIDLIKKGGKKLYTQAVGYDISGLLTLKRLAINAALPVHKWGFDWCEAIVNQGLPIIYVPHSTSKPWPADCIAYFVELVFFFSNCYRQSLFRAPALPVTFRKPLSEYISLIRAMAADLRPPYELWIRMLCYELHQVAKQLISFVTFPGDKERPNLLLWLLESAFRGLAFSLGSLRYQGIGFGEVWPSDPATRRLIQLIREERCTTRARLSRRLNALRRSSIRDQLLEQLAHFSILSLQGKNVESVSWDSFLLDLPSRFNFPPICPADKDVTIRWRDVYHPMVDVKISGSENQWRNASW